MPELNTYKLVGTKIVPLNRFNLEEGKVSTSYNTAAVKENPASFSVVTHPVLNSIALNPVIIGILNKEYLPLIEDSSTITQDSVFTDYNEQTIKLQFPSVEIFPLNNNQIFYYEDVLNEKSESSGLLGKVTLNYAIKNKEVSSTLQNITINLREAILNLKVKDNTVKINGVVDESRKEITFNIKDEAVKIAFTNLITNIEELKSNIDLFFSFKGYTKARKNYMLANAFNFTRLSSTGIMPVRTTAIRSKMTIEQPLVVRENVRLKESVSSMRIENNTVQAEYIKCSFILKINKVLNYPLGSDPAKSLYRKADGGFVHNPFNFNQDFSLYEQIFVPGINLDKLSIYKSKITVNEFLLISKRYHIARTSDTQKPCVTTVFHATEEDSGLSNDISKISFQFAISPDLSEYDLNKLKIDLRTHNFLDGDTTNYFDKVNFIYPNDLPETTYEINGNSFLQNANISVDGKYFLIDFSTENLNDASILINTINNSLSQYANINFKHKEIRDTSVIELNIQKTIGEILTVEIDNVLKRVTHKNESLSTCKVKSVQTVDEADNAYFCSSPFTNYVVESEQTRDVSFNLINTAFGSKTLKKVFFDFESIENISKEFSNIVATSNNFNKYIQVQIASQKTTTSKIHVELTVLATGAIFNLERLKADFKNPLLINFLLTGMAGAESRINFNATYFDKDNNIASTQSGVFDFSNSTVLTIPKK
ncbi:hypothetical protein NAT51_05995 [Flavobacterium amniphilum]|uniref:hypothetical protein n=1 Tax=Flavobacterium amniphilum TaxID=1834035 RepID=UPI002029FC48|nr:hypothetical protein [Flavobacterium amniphilum]MCL9805060.1 hypothetical protein [Flavobacterium amniphilum]